MTGGPAGNLDPVTVAGFGEEWAAFDQSGLRGAEYSKLFDSYFGVIPFDELPDGAEGFDLGCGSGRWVADVAPGVGMLHCIDPSKQALAAAERSLSGQASIYFHLAAADSILLPDRRQDFGYSLGVLNHVPDSGRAPADCVSKLKPGPPFLLHLYYKLDGRPDRLRALWHATELGRRAIARLPFPARKAATAAIAAMVYWRSRGSPSWASAPASTSRMSH